MQTLATLLIGYSLFSAVIISLTHFHRENYFGQQQSRLAGVLLLMLLAALQLSNLLFLTGTAAFIHSPIYRLLLFSFAPVFYLFSQPLLQQQTRFKKTRLLHFIPLLVAVWFPYQIALPLAFFLGAGYLLWLAWVIYILREQRFRFRYEITLLFAVFLIAVVVTWMGIRLSSVGELRFYTLYAIAIGGAFLLVSLVLGMHPKLAEQVSEAAREAYSVTTLTNIDSDAVLNRLDGLMRQDAVYQNSELDLTGLARQVGVSSHQLSELVNTRLGKNFPRFLREYRIEAAKAMLLEEPDASVLSVGLSAGFTSQSSFYDAFREITGMTPGKYRALHTSATPE